MLSYLFVKYVSSLLFAYYFPLSAGTPCRAFPFPISLYLPLSLSLSIHLSIYIFCLTIYLSSICPLCIYLTLLSALSFPFSAATPRRALPLPLLFRSLALFLSINLPYLYSLSLSISPVSVLYLLWTVRYGSFHRSEGTQ